MQVQTKAPPLGESGVRGGFAGWRDHQNNNQFVAETQAARDGPAAESVTKTKIRNWSETARPGDALQAILNPIFAVRPSAAPIGPRAQIFLSALLGVADAVFVQLFGTRIVIMTEQNFYALLGLRDGGLHEKR